MHREIEMETKLKMKFIPRSTSEALKFLRQVRFLPDFDPDRAAVSSVRRKVTKNHRNFTIERPLNIGDANRDSEIAELTTPSFVA